MSSQAIISERQEGKPVLEKTKTDTKVADVQLADNGLSIPELIIEEVGQDAYEFISKYIDFSKGDTLLTSTTTRFNIDKIPSGKFNNIVNIKRVNNIRRLNKFFESVNAKMTIGSLYIDSVETYVRRKARILRKYFFPLNWLIYTIDVFLTRVVPKVPVTKQIYFWITKGKNRVLSRAETYGRLYSCGFEILDTSEIGDVQYFVCRKIKRPVFDNNPTYGPFIKLKRHGKNGELFNVYKLRTMHAYSEYLQEYVYRMNDLQEGGKFKDDFRITTEGKFFRKFWLDELPMLVNLLKGEMKIVGVRPLSSHYFNLYSDELKEKRIKHKPGLIPPFYADLPKTLDEIMESEMRYLEACEKHPLITDVRYFIKAFNNIIFKKARSQ
jgi:lipopolysaccharide/colanic/teichoic acid biosynthesis glycosyltransferase